MVLVQPWDYDKPSPGDQWKWQAPTNCPTGKSLGWREWQTIWFVLTWALRVESWRRGIEASRRRRARARAVVLLICAPQRLQTGHSCHLVGHQLHPGNCPFRQIKVSPLHPHSIRNRRCRRQWHRHRRRPKPRPHHNQAWAQPNQANGASPFKKPRARRNQYRNLWSLWLTSCTRLKMKIRYWISCGPRACFKTWGLARRSLTQFRPNFPRYGKIQEQTGKLPWIRNSHLPPYKQPKMVLTSWFRFQRWTHPDEGFATRWYVWR